MEEKTEGTRAALTPGGNLDPERNCRNKRATIQGFQGRVPPGVTAEGGAQTLLAGGVTSWLSPWQEGQRVAATPGTSAPPPTGR